MRKYAYDIGGVFAPDLADRRLENGEHRLVQPATLSLEVLREMGSKYGADNQYIISRTRTDRERAANWELLRSWNFWSKTGIPAENTIIYRGTREEKSKYVEQYHITDMVDDRVEVLVHMPEQVRLVVFCPKTEEQREFEPLLCGRPLVVVADWEELGRHYGVLE